MVYSPLWCVEYDHSYPMSLSLTSDAHNGKVYCTKLEGCNCCIDNQREFRTNLMFVFTTIAGELLKAWGTNLEPI